MARRAFLISFSFHCSKLFLENDRGSKPAGVQGGAETPAAGGERIAPHMRWASLGAHTA